MFPIIPQFLTGKIIDNGEITVRKTIDEAETKSDTKINSSRRFIASSIIEKNSCSEEFTASDILNEPETSVYEEVRIFSNHRDVMLNSSKGWSWLKDANLADDCHSYNVELRAIESSPSSQHFRLKATRTINVDDLLVLWFSHEILIRLQIPHLTLTNIRGEKQYICHKCPYQCEMPNPLKIHLALECDRLPKTYLWQRLLHTRYTIDSTITPLLNPIPSVQMTKLVKSKSTNSAFKPYRKTAFKINSNKPTENDKTIKTHSTSPNMIVNQDFTNTQSNFLYKRAVEMETIVSNLGRFKQGHLCIYCGKVYSRKYGLKIHIRTHTGFKPLKCKFCLRPFGDPSNLNKHVRLHADGDTPYKCEQCGKILVRKRDLERHIKSRH